MRLDASAKLSSLSVSTSPLNPTITIITMQPHLILSKKITLAALFASLTTLTSVAIAQTPPSAKPEPVFQVSDGWRFAVTPYLWLVNINGSVYYDDTRLGRADLSSSELLSHLNAAGMVTLEAHKGRLGLVADLVYSKISSQNSTIRGSIDLGSKTTVEQGIYTFAGSYTVHNSPSAYVDALVGLRVMDMRASTAVSVAGTPPGLTKSKNITTTDPIIGLKGRVQLGTSDYFVPFYIDVGGGSSNTEVTSQQMVGVGRAFSWGDTTLGVKNLYYKQKANGVTTDQSLYGVTLGVTFKF